LKLNGKISCPDTPQRLLKPNHCAAAHNALRGREFGAKRRP
jgi:hypothetical protein